MPPRLDLDEAAVTNKYEAGATVEELARLYGCSTQPIRRVLRDAHVQLRQGGAKQGDASLRRSFTPEQEDEIVRLYTQERQSASEIGRAFGVTRGTVLNALRRRGATIRRRRLVDDDSLKALAQRYEAGDDLLALAREVGYQRAGLYEAFKAIGVQMRVRGKPPTALDDARVQAVIARIESGTPAVRASKEAGISHTVVARLLRESGRPLRQGGNRWNGGRVVDSQGYVRIWVDADDPMASMRNSRGYVPEHRLVMARSLGRPLTRGEQVHHINGDKHDNSPENLQLRSGNHGSGTVLVCRACGSHDIGTAPI